MPVTPLIAEAASARGAAAGPGSCKNWLTLEIGGDQAHKICDSACACVQ